MLRYFAYGSNMDPEQLRDREVAFREPQRCTLPHWKLTFNKVAALNAVPGEGRANIVPVRGRRVEGVLFGVSETCLENLDWYEGAKSGHYARRTIVVRDENGAEMEAITYVAQFIGTGLRPSPWYLQKIVRGARHYGLSPDYVAALEAWPTVGPAQRPE